MRSGFAFEMRSRSRRHLLASRVRPFRTPPSNRPDDDLYPSGPLRAPRRNAPHDSTSDFGAMYIVWLFIPYASPLIFFFLHFFLAYLPPLLIFENRPAWRWKPGCQIVGSVTIVWLSTKADDQSSLHCTIHLHRLNACQN